MTYGAFASRGTIPASDINQEFALDLIQERLRVGFSLARSVLTPLSTDFH